ncbi:hypothetical protein [Ralstonia sp. UNC404CL21Col]|uniref:hypothetical protein n=1 Tax=Ralstonia sp. UNC404CL21Col TaxID=1380362 RepID=UPI000687AE6A|nr:hypothetical protein [Ralstonia sp. UNC404CL21Col]
MNVDAILKSRYPNDVVRVIIDAYREIEGNYILGKWKASELDAGHFVEGVRRALESELFGSFTPIGVDMPKFHDGELKKYEQATGDESFRILIPRALKAVFNIRNKRGVGHVGAISPNEMDATYILYTAKWVLAELVRLASGTDPASAQKTIDSIVERRLSLIWKHGDITRVLKTDLTTREQLLVLLYDKSPQKESALKISTEYKNLSNFRRILKRLHADRLIEYVTGETATLTPAGIAEAELALTKASKKGLPQKRSSRRRVR